MQVPLIEFRTTNVSGYFTRQKLEQPTDVNGSNWLCSVCICIDSIAPGLGNLRYRGEKGRDCTAETAEGEAILCPGHSLPTLTQAIGSAETQPMEVLEHTPTQLVLRHRPWINWIAGGSVAAIGAVSIGFAVVTPGFRVSPSAILALLAGVWAANSPVLTCRLNREEQQVKLHTRNLFRAQDLGYPLPSITGAEGHRYGILLIVDEQKCDLTFDQLRLPGSERKYQAIAAEIQSFLDSSQ